MDKRSTDQRRALGTMIAPRKAAVLRAMLILVLVVVQATAAFGQSTNLFQTDFETEEGYDIERDLIGQNGWVGVGTGGTGLVSDFFEESGQQAYIGFSPPDGSDSFLSVWQPLNFEPLAQGFPRILFTTEIEIVDSTNDRFDDFRWSVYNKNEDRLFTLDFDNVDRVISYALDGDNSFVSTGFAFASDGRYELSISMNFEENMWNVSLNGVSVVSSQPITTTEAELTLGDIDAVWAIRTPGEPGDNFMVFENYRVVATTGESTTARLAPIGRLADGRFLLRIFGERGRHYAVEGSADLSAWLTLKEFTAPEPDGVFEFLDDTAAGNSSRFYRTRLIE